AAPKHSKAHAAKAFRSGSITSPWGPCRWSLHHRNTERDRRPSQTWLQHRAIEASQQDERRAADWRSGVATSKTWMFCARVREGCPDRAKSDPWPAGRGVDPKAGKRISSFPVASTFRRLEAASTKSGT